MMNFTITWESLIFPMIALGYILMLRRIDREERSRQLTDEEFASGLARSLGISEYELFFVSARTWRVAEQRVEQDFRAYLQRESMPYYVKDYIRKNRGEIARV